MRLPPFVQEFIDTAAAIAREGWAEANAGNLSLRMRDEMIGQWLPYTQPGPWMPLEYPIQSLSGDRYLFTVRGCQLRNLPLYPSRDCGVIELGRTGESYRILWGMEGSIPTSEFMAHLQSHAVRKTVSGGLDRALLHVHPTHLVALSHVMSLDDRTLTHLLWSMHPEAVLQFPGGMGFLPFAVPGSADLARMTCTALEERPMVLWEFHGVFASAPSLEQAFGMVQAAEKAAMIYRAAIEMGGVRRGLSMNQMKAMADRCHLPIGPGLLQEEPPVNTSAGAPVNNGINLDKNV